MAHPGLVCVDRDGFTWHVDGPGGREDYVRAAVGRVLPNWMITPYQLFDPEHNAEDRNQKSAALGFLSTVMRRRKAGASDIEESSWTDLYTVFVSWCNVHGISPTPCKGALWWACFEKRVVQWRSMRSASERERIPVPVPGRHVSLPMETIMAVQHACNGPPRTRSSPPVDFMCCCSKTCPFAM